MAQITDPIMLDSTGQAIKNSIDLLSANINRTASNIPYDNNLTIKGKIDDIEDEITDVSNSATYTTGDEIDLDGFVALGYLRGNRKRVDFVVPVNKDLSNSTLALSGTWSLFDLTDGSLFINGEDINATGNTVTITKMNGYLLIQLTRADNITTSRMCGLYLGADSKITIS